VFGSNQLREGAMSAGGIKVDIPFRIWVPHPGGLRIPAPHGDFAQLRRTGGEDNGFENPDWEVH